MMVRNTKSGFMFINRRSYGVICLFLSIGIAGIAGQLIVGVFE